MTTIRFLGPGDEGFLGQLADQDALFSGDGPGDAAAYPPSTPLAPEVATAYLLDPATWHWGAFDDDGALVGHLHAFVHRIRHGSGFEVVLFDIAVRHDRRLQGIGRALLEELHTTTAATPCRTIWVLADNPEARAFYEAAGYVAPADQPTYLELAVPPA